MTTTKSNFQRGVSKVWWGNSNLQPADLPPNLQFGTYYHETITEESDRTPIESINDPQSSMVRRDSPGSLRSQDSGFDDTNEHHHHSPNLSTTNRSDKLTPKKTINHQINSIIHNRRTSLDDTGSPSDHSLVSIQTPPTVIRKIQNSTIRRISFGDETDGSVEFYSSQKLFQQIDNLQLTTNSTKNLNLRKNRTIRRGRTISRSSKVNRKLSLTNSTEIIQPPAEYNNETVVFGMGDGLGESDDENNNVNKTPDGKVKILPTYEELFPTSTSTPKMDRFESYRSKNSYSPSELHLSPTFKWDSYTYTNYSNPLLNGNSSSIQFWLDETRTSYCHEVLSTLQTKSVAQEAARYHRLNSVLAATLIQDLQSKAMRFKPDFDRLEKLVKGTNEIDPDSQKECITEINRIMTTIVQFLKRIECRQIYEANSSTELSQFESNLSGVRDIIQDLNRICRDDFNVEQIIEDLYILKRYLLITLRMVFTVLIRIIIRRIENPSGCTLILRSNLSMISSLSNIEYDGFASLNDAFLNTETPRTLLMCCIESRESTIRSIALRALATVCSTAEMIRQFEVAGGVEIVRDIIVDGNKDQSGLGTIDRRGDREIREAISVLTQVTAAWHGARHTVRGLKDGIEPLIQSITNVVRTSRCCQTVLLCAALLNNLSWMESTTSYSLMSNETVMKLKEAIDSHGSDGSIFLYDQVIGMLLNMSANKKCHNHLANGDIIKFIVDTFQSLFDRTPYPTRSENEAHRRTIKNIMHIFARLIHGSIVGQEVLGNNFIPIFSKIEQELSVNVRPTSIMTTEYTKDLLKLSKKLNDSIKQSTGSITMGTVGEKQRRGSTSSEQRIESYV